MNDFFTPYFVLIRQYREKRIDRTQFMESWEKLYQATIKGEEK